MQGGENVNIVWVRETRVNLRLGHTGFFLGFLFKLLGGLRPPSSLNEKALEMYPLFLHRVWHKGILFKLRQNDIKGKLLELLNTYSSQRKQKVGRKSSFSGFKSIFAGVP